MRTTLHLLTTRDPLAGEIIALQKSEPELSVQTVDLTEPAPDYALLLQRIFEADSITVW